MINRALWCFKKQDGGWLYANPDRITTMEPSVITPTEIFTVKMDDGHSYTCVGNLFAIVDYIACKTCVDVLPCEDRQRAGR